MNDIGDGCARVASGQIAAVPPRSVMNFRRLMDLYFQADADRLAHC